jgi:hypothetical protein
MGIAKLAIQDISYKKADAYCNQIYKLITIVKYIQILNALNAMPDIILTIKNA